MQGAPKIGGHILVIYKGLDTGLRFPFSSHNKCTTVEVCINYPSSPNSISFWVSWSVHENIVLGQEVLSSRLNRLIFFKKKNVTVCLCS